MFDFFKKKPDPAEPDHVYMTASARANAVVKAGILALASGARVVVVSPFRGHLEALANLLPSRGLPCSLLGSSYRSAAEAPGTALLVDGPAFVRSSSSIADGERVELLLVERHPLRAHDDAIEKALSRSSPRGKMRVFLSLDDGLLSIFGSNVSDMMRKMGMAEDEAVEHPFVTRAIENAQAKMAKAVTSERHADTFDDWRRLNLK